MKRKVATGKTGKPLVGVVAFLGRGNSGDEAMFQCIYEAFSPDFDIVAVVDEVGARPGFWDWYPYTHCDRVHMGNIHYFEKPMAGLIVGGGGLGIGFGAGQALVARGAGTPTILAGINHTHHYPTSQSFVSATVEYMKLFDYISMRSLASVESAQKDGVEVNYGADWAMNLVADQASDIEYNSKRVTLVLREHAMSALDQPYYKGEVERLVRALKQDGLSPEFLPFCPEDEVFLKEVGVDKAAPAHIHWWNARRLKQIVDCSGLLISIGRLHPMIYAFASGVPCIQLQPPLKPILNARMFGKTTLMAEEMSIPYFCTIDDVVTEIRNSDWRVFHSDEKAVEAKGRLELMISDIRSLLRGR